MELLDFYAKILPDKLFAQARDQRAQPKYWVGDSYDTIAGASVIKDIDNVVNPDNTACGETGCYTTLLGFHLPLQRQSKQPNLDRFLMDDPNLRFQPKREIANMFDPRQGILQNNVSVETDAIKERMTTSIRQNDGTEKGLRIGPGLGRGAEDNTQRGIHPTFRILPRNIDNLRTPLHAKTVYENPVPVLGKVASKGISTQHIGKVIKKTADTFTDKPIAIRPQAQVPRATQYGKPLDLPTQRQVRSDPVTGHAHARHIQKGATDLDQFFEEPLRNEYREPDPMHVGRGGMSAINDPNAVLLQDTQRQIPTTTQVPAASNASRAIAVHPEDKPRDTHRQTMVAKGGDHGNVRGSSQSTRYSVEGLTPALTQRDSSIAPKPGPASSFSSASVMYNKSDWTPHETIRQSTQLIPTQTQVAPQRPAQQPVIDPMGWAPATTLRESTEEATSWGNIGEIPRHVPVIDYDDVARHTTRQTTGSITIAPAASSSTRGKYTPAGEPLPRNQGARQVVNEVSTVGTVGMMGMGQIVHNPQDIPTIPHRETIGSAPVVGNRASAGGYGNVISKDFQPRDSLRETTQENPDSMRASQTNKGYVTRDPRDLPKETGRQTLRTADVTNATRSSIGHRLHDEDGSVKETHRQTLSTKTVAQHPARGNGGGYRTDATEFKETQRQLGSETNVIVGAKHAQTLPTLFEHATLRLNDCLDESWGRIEGRTPTVVGGANLPSKNVSVGSVYLKPDEDQENTRSVAPRPPVYLFETPNFSNISTRLS